MKAPEAKIVISIGRNRRDKMWRIQEMTWSQLVERLSRFKTGDETHQEYLNKSKDEQSELKDIGGFVGGAVNGGRRVIGSVATRTLFTGDADHADDSFLFNAEISLPFSYVIYNTRKHGPTGHRYRLVVPFDRPCNAVEYGAVSRYICRMLGMNLWDKTTLEMNRLMYWPSHSRDVPPVFDVQNRGILNVDSVLATYKDYTDISEWAKFPTETEIRVGNEKGAMQDPREKPHVIGAFCRAYGVNEAIAQFLPDVYRVSSHDPNRYTFIGGESSNGAVVYDNLHLYSNHQTDPVHGKSLNAFDLVRVHKFGHLDADLDDFERLELSSMPSQEAMTAWAKSLEPIRAEMSSVRLAPLLEAEQLISTAASHTDLLVVATSQIKGLPLDSAGREMTAQRIKARMRDLGTVMGIDHCRAMIAPDVTQIVQSEREWLTGFVFNTYVDRFYNVLTGAELTKTGFNACYNRFIDGDDPDAAKEVLNAGAVDSVRNVMYAPMLGARFEFEGAPMANRYRPATVPVAADALDENGIRVAAKVRGHIGRLFSGRTDLVESFLQYLAHNVQYPGIKIRRSWLIKGCEGDGKSIIHDLMAAVLGRSNTAQISAHTVCSPFNGYAEGTIFSSFEEVRIAGHNRYEIYNAIKPLITNNVVEIHRKGVDGYQAMNCTNYLFFSNFIDPLPLDENDRRLTVVFSPFKSQRELLEVVGADYFADLIDDIQGNAAQLRRWFLDMDLSGFDRHKAAEITQEKVAMGCMNESEHIAPVLEMLENRTCVSFKQLRVECDLAGLTLSTKQLAKVLLEAGWLLWYRQIKISKENVSVYGKGAPLSREEVRTLLEVDDF